MPMISITPTITVTTKDFDKDDLKKSIFDDTIDPTSYDDGTTYYNIDCSKKIKEGYYVVVVYDNEDLDNVLARSLRSRQGCIDRLTARAMLKIDINTPSSRK